MSINTLKTAKVGDKVTMLTFTGMNLGQFEIAKAGKTKLAVMTKKGFMAEFSRETGIQLNANNPKFANKIVDPIDEAAPKAAAPKAEKKAAAKKAPKAKAAEVEEEEEVAEEAPKKPAKKAAKPAKKVEKVEIPEDADDFEDEDLDDDFEDFDEE